MSKIIGTKSIGVFTILAWESSKRKQQRRDPKEKTSGTGAERWNKNDPVRYERYYKNYYRNKRKYTYIKEKFYLLHLNKKIKIWKPYRENLRYALFTKGKTNIRDYWTSNFSSRSRWTWNKHSWQKRSYNQGSVMLSPVPGPFSENKLTF